MKLLEVFLKANTDCVMEDTELTHVVGGGKAARQVRRARRRARRAARRWKRRCK